MVKVSKLGFITRSITLNIDQEEDIVLTRTLKVKGKVIDAESKQPIERFRLLWSGRKDDPYFANGNSKIHSDGVYAVDVEKLHADSWFEGYFSRFVLRVEAKGYAPAMSRLFSSRDGDEGSVVHDFELKTSREIEGRVVDHFGHSVEGAQIAQKPKRWMGPRLNGTTPAFINLDKVRYTVSDANGLFRMHTEPVFDGAAIAAEVGFAVVPRENFISGIEIKLKPWATIKGTLWKYDQRLAGEKLSVDFSSDTRLFESNFNVTTDEQGQFSIEYVPPLTCRLYRMIPVNGGGTSGPMVVSYLEPGQTLTVKIGGRGRPVVGKFVVKNEYVKLDFRRGEKRFHTIPPKQPDALKTAEERLAWLRTPEVNKAYNLIRNHPVIFSPDGSFRIDEVIPGKYAFGLKFLNPLNEHAAGYSESDYIANFIDEFDIPESQVQNSQVPLDLGELTITLKPRIE